MPVSRQIESYFVAKALETKVRGTNRESSVEKRRVLVPRMCCHFRSVRVRAQVERPPDAWLSLCPTVGYLTYSVICVYGFFTQTKFRRWRNSRRQRYEDNPKRNPQLPGQNTSIILYYNAITARLHGPNQF